MDFFRKNKNIVIGLGVLILVFGGFFVWKSMNTSPNDSTASTLSFNDSTLPGSFSEASLAGQQILSLLNQLRQLNINGDIFKDPVFTSLVDYSIATTSEPRGRPDPFEPLPFELASPNVEKK